MAVKRKKILELYDYGDGLSIRRISELLGSSRNTVRRVIDRAGELGITKEVLATESAAGIDALFRDAGGSDDGRFAPIDYAYVAKELDERGVNRKLLWKEYCQESAQLGQTPYQYSQFYELFRQWSGKSNVTVRLVHKPGYACQVDWALSIKTDNDQSTSTTPAALWPTLLVTCLDMVQSPYRLQNRS